MDQLMCMSWQNKHCLLLPSGALASWTVLCTLSGAFIYFVPGTTQYVVMILFRTKQRLAICYSPSNGFLAPLLFSIKVGKRQIINARKMSHPNIDAFKRQILYWCTVLCSTGAPRSPDFPFLSPTLSAFSTLSNHPNNSIVPQLRRHHIE